MSTIPTATSLGTTFTSLLGTVQTTANAVTSTVSGIATAGDMFNNYMSNKAKEQRILSQKNLAKSVLFAEDKLLMEVAKHKELQRKFIDEDPRNADLLSLADKEIKRVIEELKTA